VNAALTSGFHLALWVCGGTALIALLAIAALRLRPAAKEHDRPRDQHELV